jgi:hypothetical protein
VLYRRSRRELTATVVLMAASAKLLQSVIRRMLELKIFISVLLHAGIGRSVACEGGVSDIYTYTYIRTQIRTIKDTQTHLTC